MSPDKPIVVRPESTAPSFDHLQRMATTMAKSKLFGISDPDQALSLMLVAVAEGRSPALVARDYHVIQNRPAKKAEAMLRDFQAAGGKVQWHKLDDTIADATFSHPQGGEIRITWDIPRAERAGLTQKDGSMYKKYARPMLRSRCVTEGIRTIWPGATSGMYSPEEIRDIQIDVTPPKSEADLERITTEVAQSIATALSLDEVEGHVDAMGDALTIETLQAAYMAAHQHAKAANDNQAVARFKAVYALRSADIQQTLGALI